MPYSRKLWSHIVGLYGKEENYSSTPKEIFGVRGISGQTDLAAFLL